MKNTVSPKTGQAIVFHNTVAERLRRSFRFGNCENIRSKQVQLALTFMLCLLFSPAHAASWYVDSAATGGARNGRSWTDAWSSFSSIVWGSSGVKAGDTLYISGGTSSKSYSGTFTVGASGTQSSRITIKAGQDSGHNGTVIFNGNIVLAQNYVTLDGEYQGQRHFYLPGRAISGSGAVAPIIRYVEISNVGLGIAMVYGSGGEFAYNKITGITTDAAIRLNARNQGVSNFDQTLIHDNEIQINGQINNGNGPDGIQTGDSVSFYDNFIYSRVGPVTGAEHQDLIQTYGTNYHKIYNNIFDSTGDAQVGIDMGGSTADHIWIFNNIFSNTVSNMGTLAVRIYNSNGSLTSFNDIRIDNNTFVDWALTGSSYGAAIRLVGNNASASNCSIRNNIFFNCGRGWPVILVQGVNTSEWSYDYNLFNAGPSGSTVSNFGSQAHGQTGIPQFVSYSQGSPSNNLRLSSADTAARDRGVSLAYIETDMYGVSRPVGSGYDIGACEYSGAGSPNPTPTPTATPSPSPQGLSFSASSGTITGIFEVQSDGDILQSIETPLSDSGRASYLFTVPSAGDYTISAVVNAANTASDSFFVNIDAEPTDPLTIWDILPATNGFETRTVGWRGNGTFDNPQYPVRTFSLSAGLHELIIRGREGNVQLRSITIVPSDASAPAAPTGLRVTGP